MTRTSDSDRLLASWIEDGPTSGPPHVLASALGRTRSTRQRPAWVPRWWDLPEPTRIASVALAAILVVVVGASVLAQGAKPGIGGSGAGSGQGPGSSAGVTPVPASACVDGSPGCLGALVAGSYTAPKFGIAFTVPDGWMNLVDSPGWFLLAPRDEKLRQAGSGKWLAVIPDVLIAAQGTGCRPAPDPTVGHTVDDMVTYLTHHPGLVTSTPTPVTIGGLAGTSVDLHVAPTWTTACSGSTDPEVSYLTENNTGGYRWSAGSHEYQRMTFLDDGKGGVIVVAINSPTAAGFDSLVQAAAPIINSFSFHRGARSPSSSPSPSP